MSARLSAFVIWALVAASAVFWGMRWLARPPAAPAHTVAAADAAPMRADLTRLFGAPVVATQAVDEAPAASSRFELTGVMAPKGRGGPGIALIAIDGKTPRAYRLGAVVDGDLVLQSVTHRTVALGPAQGEPSIVLEMPALPEPTSTGVPPTPAPMPYGAAARPARTPFTPPRAAARPGMPIPPSSPQPAQPLNAPPGQQLSPPLSPPLGAPAAPTDTPGPGGVRDRLPPASTR